MHRPAYSSFSIESLIGPSQPRPSPVLYSGYVLVPGTTGLGPAPTPPGTLSAETIRYHAALQAPFTQQSLFTAQTLALQTGLQTLQQHTSLTPYNNVSHISAGLHPHPATVPGMTPTNLLRRSPLSMVKSGDKHPLPGEKGPDHSPPLTDMDQRSDSRPNSPIDLSDEGEYLT